MLASALISLLIMGRQAQAYFVLGQTPMSTQRIDPIVNPGKEASHVHSFAGVNTVQMTTSLETLEGADCTGSGIQVDKSAYWAPTLYAFDPAKAEFTRLKNTFTNTYYFNRNGKSTKEIEAYPKGIRFLSGNAMATDFDSETVEQITFVCLRGSSPGFESKTLPADFTTCDYGLRLQIHLKTCYDGKPLDMSASDHSAHLAWAGSGNTGDCDPDHPVRLPSQFHEWVYEVNKVAPGSQLVLANGDTVGYTFHVDFISGWDTDVLKKAMNDPSCDEAAFSPAKCAPLSSHIQDDKIKSECPKQVKLSVTEEIDGPLKALPGCNRIFNGPHVGKDKPNACASPVPAGVYAENLYPDPINGPFKPLPQHAQAPPATAGAAAVPSVAPGASTAASAASAAVSSVATGTSTAAAASVSSVANGTSTAGAVTTSAAAAAAVETSVAQAATSTATAKQTSTTTSGSFPATTGVPESSGSDGPPNGAPNSAVPADNAAVDSSPSRSSNGKATADTKSHDVVTGASNSYAVSRTATSSKSTSSKCLSPTSHVPANLMHRRHKKVSQTV